MTVTLSLCLIRNGIEPPPLFFLLEADELMVLIHDVSCWNSTFASVLHIKSNISKAFGVTKKLKLGISRART